MEDEVIAIPVAKPGMSSLYFTVLMALNVVLFIVGYGMVQPLLPCGLVVAIALWQVNVYWLYKEVAEHKTMVAILSAVNGVYHNRLQALESDGTNGDESCLIEGEQRTGEVQENDTTE